VRSGVVLLGICMLVSPATGEDFGSHTNPVCWKEPRIYHPGGARAAELEGVAKRVLQLGRAKGTLPQPQTLSRNGAYAFHYSERPEPGAPSGSTKVALLVFKERPYLLSVQADAVQSLQDPLWLNEKLISFRLWLSRLGGVDLLVDVEQENVVWMEAFADGGTIWQQARESCNAVPHVAVCDEPCTSLK
jgi:hypothetical protein